MTKLLNLPTILGLSTVISIAGVGLNNSSLTTVGLNIGISGAAITSVFDKAQKQQQRDRELSKQMVNIAIQTQQQQSAFNLLKQSLEINKNNAVQQHNNLCAQICDLKNDLENTNKKSQQQQQCIEAIQAEGQQAIQQQIELDKKVGRAQLQLNNHNKKLKKQQHDINIQKANQNKVLSEVQKTKNQQQQFFAENTKHQNAIIKQVDKIIELGQSNTNIAPSAPQTKIAPPVLATEPKTRVYIDNNNLYNCLEFLEIELDYQALMIMLTAQTGKTTIKLYDGAFPNQKHKYLPLKKLGYQVFTLPISKRGKDKPKTVGDDVKLSVDMVKDVREGDFVTLVSGDGDYVPAIEEIKKRNVEVTVIAQKNAVNRDLVVLADKVIYLDDLADKIAKHTKLIA